MRDLLDLLSYGQLQLVDIREILIAAGFRQANDFFCQSFSACSALFPNFGEFYRYAEILAAFADQFHFGIRIRGEFIDGHNNGKLVNLRDVADVFQQVGEPFFEKREVLRTQIRLGNAAVVLESADGGH